MSRLSMVCLVALALTAQSSRCQNVGPGLRESFDDVIAPDLPAGWQVSGFVLSASVPRSAPNAIAATGNMRACELMSPVLDLEGAHLEELTFHERRSSTASLYKLEVSASVDGFASLVFRETFETISVLSSYVKRTVDLSALGERDVAGLRIRWSILPDSTNSTGVLRIDDVSLTARFAEDLSVTRVHVLPSQVTSLSPFVVCAHLANAGIAEVSEYQVEFFLDGGARFAALAGPPLRPGDSATVEAEHRPVQQGRYKILAAVSGPQDGNPTNDSASVELQVGVPAGTVLINEIMYAPAGDEPEWIELVNVSPDTVSVVGWKISDHGLSRKAVIATADPELKPGEYGIVARDLSFVTFHPSNLGPVFTAEFSALNNASADGPILFTEQGLTVDSVCYEPSWGGQDGRSLERRDTEALSTDALTWASSTDSLGSTPGRENSTARLAFDLTVASVSATVAESEDGWLLTITVSNVGKNIVTEHEVVLFEDRNNNRQSDESEQVALLRSENPLLPGESVRHECTIVPGVPGEHLMIASARTGMDQRMSNNQGYVMIVKRHAPGALIVNEVMYEPLENSCEWIELYNPTDFEVDVHNWKLSDAATPSGSTNCYILSDSVLGVQPGEFVVIAGDSTIQESPFYVPHDSEGIHLVLANRISGLGLGNDGDAIVLKDAAGSAIDSLAYDPAMHHPYVLDVRGRSLERIRESARTNDRSNWSTASGPAGGSPGRRNTIAVAAVSSAATVEIHPNPFSPDDDGWEDFCVIGVELPFPAACIRVRVFDTRGRKVRTLAAEENVGAQSQIIWNGLDDRRLRVPVGPYVVLVEATDPFTGRKLVHKAVAVVGRHL